MTHEREPEAAEPEPEGLPEGGEAEMQRREAVLDEAEQEEDDEA